MSAKTLQWQQVQPHLQPNTIGQELEQVLAEMGDRITYLGFESHATETKTEALQGIAEQRCCEVRHVMGYLLQKDTSIEVRKKKGQPDDGQPQYAEHVLFAPSRPVDAEGKARYLAQSPNTSGWNLNADQSPPSLRQYTKDEGGHALSKLGMVAGSVSPLLLPASVPNDLSLVIEDTNESEHGALFELPLVAENSQHISAVMDATAYRYLQWKIREHQETGKVALLYDAPQGTDDLQSALDLLLSGELHNILISCIELVSNNPALQYKELLARIKKITAQLAGYLQDKHNIQRERGRRMANFLVQHFMNVESRILIDFILQKVRIGLQSVNIKQIKQASNTEFFATIFPEIQRNEKAFFMNLLVEAYKLLAERAKKPINNPEQQATESEAEADIAWLAQYLEKEIPTTHEAAKSQDILSSADAFLNELTTKWNNTAPEEKTFAAFLNILQDEQFYQEVAQSQQCQPETAKALLGIVMSPLVEAVQAVVDAREKHGNSVPEEYFLFQMAAAHDFFSKETR